MIPSSIFQTIEFYVITAVIAAAVVAFAAMPSRKSAARTLFFTGTLLTDAPPGEPQIVAVVNDHGALELHRLGIDGLTTNGAYNLAVTIIGFDVTIEERITPGNDSCYAHAAFAVIDNLGAERYHFLYHSEAIGRNAAFSLNIRAGNRISRALS
ncbi:MAG: hypothetical protein J1F05_08755 [Muribaculaceae bacterium]|nr:hypothetical protein [Muribaculaceae bacterium]